MAWLPIFFLYFNAHLSIKDVIILESIYYISVFVLEVPSGYFSDVLGRKKTLVLSTVFFTLAYIGFGFIEPRFEILAIAQFLLAAGFSFLSGTDTAFYYESLQAEGLEDSFPQREAKVQSYKQYAGALGALIGGIAGSYQLHLGYVLSFVMVLPSIWLALRFTEPIAELEPNNNNPLQQLKEVFSYLKIKELQWIFIYSIILYVLIHIPYEFYQPYLKLLEASAFSVPMNAALYSGFLFAGTRFVGAIVSGKSIELANYLGLKWLSFLALILQLVIIILFSLVLHPSLVILVLFRSVSMSMTIAPLNAIVAPKVAKEQRATYFSFQSLLSRLSFFITLIALSYVVPNEITNDWPTLSRIFRYSFWGGLVLSLPLIFWKSGQLFKPSNS